MKPLQERIRKLEFSRPKAIKVDANYESAISFMTNISEDEINDLAARIEASKMTQDDIEFIKLIPKFDGKPESLILRLNNLYKSI
jgi:NRPS condensation-like uncharacterized protein